MKILLTGANGYIGKRLLTVLLEQSHQVVCLVRHKNRLNLSSQAKEQVEIVVGDLLLPATLERIPPDIDIAFYLVHSMAHTAREFDQMERLAANNFAQALKRTKAQQIIYLSGISNDENLSKHLQSRRLVEDILTKSEKPVTVLRAAIIIGSGSASFEIIRDLVELLPIMITPKWLNVRCQPIAITDVLYYLNQVMADERCYQKTFDIGGPDILTYREMLLKVAKVRGLRRVIITLPVLTPRLSSYWLYFVTSTSYSLATSLVDSMKNEVICNDNEIQSLFPHICLTYEEAVRRAFTKIEDNTVVSSWKDAWISGTIRSDVSDFIQVPEHGCFRDVQEIQFIREPAAVFHNIWTIGGNRGWYYLNSLWAIRGLLDKLSGGVGLRRGRTNQNTLRPGDALDFWRVLYANKEQKRLLLLAEMKLPGEAWLEFTVTPLAKGGILRQTATFRPRGLIGRLYWYALVPIHVLIFKGMANKIIKYKTTADF
ncbi:SDR family oxidoreductase [candidate division CSSED10-310 bacterium]|uniref:SDR family oxidoreductase n=1 Tax=candidate division CSSED10-310 bacterium TaxID=2855610 RepID=A0ABV6Z398_UNCC1